MLGEQGRAIVVIAGVARHDKRIALSWQGCNHIAEGHVGEPSCAVVSGLARPHSVAGDARVAFAATGALPRVIPHGEDSACGADRNVRLPLGTGSGIGVQFKWGAESNAAVS